MGKSIEKLANKVHKSRTDDRFSVVFSIFRVRILQSVKLFGGKSIGMEHLSDRVRLYPKHRLRHRQDTTADTARTTNCVHRRVRYPRAASDTHRRERCTRHNGAQAHAHSRNAHAHRRLNRCPEQPFERFFRWKTGLVRMARRALSAERQLPNQTGAFSSSASRTASFVRLSRSFCAFATTRRRTVLSQSGTTGSLCKGIARAAHAKTTKHTAKAPNRLFCTSRSKRRRGISAKKRGTNVFFINDSSLKPAKPENFLVVLSVLPHPVFLYSKLPSVLTFADKFGIIVTIKEENTCEKGRPL